MVDLLTAPEVAELSGITLRQVQRMAKRGRLPVVLRTGRGDYLFSPEVLDLLGSKEPT